MAAQSKMLSDLEIFSKYGVSPEYFENLTPNQRMALEAQGVNLPDGSGSNLPTSDAANPLTGDENGPASTDANGITAVNARDARSSGAVPEEDPLDALVAETERLQATTAERRAADRLKAQYPNTDQAQQQSTADKVQEALGNARRVSETTQGGIRTRVFAAADRLGAVSTPGGIAGLLLILWLLLFILVEVNGQPRGVWLWLVLLRKAHLMPESQAANLSTLAPGGEEQGISASETATVSQQTVSAYGQTAAAGANITPINPAGFGSSLLSGAGNALDRYINP